MGDSRRQDLRVEKTLRAIYAAFEEMLLEMPYSKISVKELCERAMVNKKTFYHYYSNLDDLLKVLELKYADPFVKLTANMFYPQDTQAIIKEFILYSAKQGELYDRIMTKDEYASIRMHIIAEMEKDRYRLSVTPEDIPDEEWNIYLVCVTSLRLQAYRQWVIDGRNLPVDRMAEITSSLIRIPAC